MQLLLILVCLLACDRTFVSGNTEEICDFLVRVVHCIQSIQDNPIATHFTELWHHTNTIHSLIYVARRGESQESRDCAALLETLHDQLTIILHQPQNERHQGNVIAPTIGSGAPGRPRYDFTADHINHCLNLGLNWQGIASLFGIDRRTLFRHRERLGIPSRDYTTLSNERLMSIVRQILANTPNAGETYVRGSLCSRGLRVQRWRVRQVLQEIDPIGRCLRRSRAIRRRIYHVSGPNELW